MGKFWESPGGAVAISSIGSAGSGLFGGLFSSGSQRRQYKYNLKLQKQQQEWQKMMWELENAYNSPTREINRLIAAGVNPAVAFSNSGAGAAPVPQSGSAGGVAAPTAEMPNIGASAVAAAQNQQRIDNETKVAESTADKNEAEAEAARQQAGLSGVLKDYNEFNLGLDRDMRPITVKVRSLEYDFKNLTYALGYQDYVRGDVYTTNYPTLLGQKIEIGRIDIDNLRRSGDRILAETRLLQAQRKLTDEEAKIVKRKLVCATLDAMMARASMDAMNTNYDPMGGVNSSVWNQFKESVRRDVARRLQESETGLLAAGLDFGFQSKYGENLRKYNYETVRRGANAIRTQQYTGVIQSLAGIGMAAAGGVSAGARVQQVRLMRSWQNSARQFGVNVPYSGASYAPYTGSTVPYYFGGTEYSAF